MPDVLLPAGAALALLGMLGVAEWTIGGWPLEGMLFTSTEGPAVNDDAAPDGAAVALVVPDTAGVSTVGFGSDAEIWLGAAECVAASADSRSPPPGVAALPGHSHHAPPAKISSAGRSATHTREPRC